MDSHNHPELAFGPTSRARLTRRLLHREAPPAGTDSDTAMAPSRRPAKDDTANNDNQGENT